MFYFDKSDDRVLFGDIRAEDYTLSDGRALRIDPDSIMDFRALEFPNDSFHVVVFDPPHLIKAGPKSWLAAKYGKLNRETWRDDLESGFRECFRVLKPNGVLIFKWNEVQVRVSEVLALTEQRPLIGHKSGKASATHWITFIKDGSK